MTAGGYAGKMLFVDLLSGAIKEESLHESVCRDFLGGIGLGVRVLYERMRSRVDPLGPENMIGFVTGVLTGTPVSFASRYAVVGKSPLTNTWGDSNAGGFFGPELKKAGYDAIFFTGISPKPVYLFIDNGQAELKGAAHLWGKDTVETQTILQSELGTRVRVACIGPSGESISLIAAIINDEGRAAGRQGLGAVMGAKHLKAIAVKGTKKPTIADANKLSTLRQSFLKHVNENFPELFKEYGTRCVMGANVPSGLTPFKNWNSYIPETMPTWVKLREEEVIRYRVKRSGCAVCPISCGGLTQVENGPYTLKGHLPEFETLAGFGTMCLIDEVEAIIKANDICNRSGLDTISASAAIAFAMECYEHGVIGKEETGGIDLTWGNASAMVAMLENITKREFLGRILADGVKRAAEQIGKGAEKYALHIHGQELGYHSPVLEYRCIGYVADPTPGRHTTGMGPCTGERRPLGPYPELQMSSEDKGQKYAVLNNYSQAVTSSGLCFFIFTAGEFPLVEFISAVTGWDFNAAEAIETGKRIVTMRQAFNFREGIRPTDFRMPDRLITSLFLGPLRNVVIDPEALKASYYRAMDWDIESGRPSDRALQELGLQDFVNKYG